jgi:F0F1-type ATP synthase epsilon subunit
MSARVFTPGHARLMTQLTPAEMVVCQGGQNRFLAMRQGLALVKPDSVSIATDMAVPAENIDEAKPKKRGNELRLACAKRSVQKKLPRPCLAGSGFGPIARQAAQSQMIRSHAPAAGQ